MEHGSGNRKASSGTAEKAPVLPTVMAGLSFKNVGKQLLKMPTYAQPQTICAYVTHVLK